MNRQGFGRSIRQTIMEALKERSRPELEKLAAQMERAGFHRQAQTIREISEAKPQVH